MKTAASFLMVFAINFAIALMIRESFVYEICIDSGLACVAVLRGGL